MSDGVSASLAAFFLLIFCGAVFLTALEKPGLRWKKSSNGNAMLVRDGYRVTVFRNGTSWTYAASRVGQSQAWYSDRYNSEAEAKSAAIYNEFGIGIEVLSNRERKDVADIAKFDSEEFRDDLRSDALALKSKLFADTEKANQIISDVSKPPRVKTFKKRLKSGQNHSRRIAMTAMEAGLDNLGYDALDWHDDYSDLLELIEAHEAGFSERASHTL